MTLFQKLIIRTWVSFVKSSLKKREKLISNFERTLASLDHSVAQQKAMTTFMIKKVLHLKDNDVIYFKEDGSYRVEEK